MLRLNRWRRRTIRNDEKAEKLLNNLHSCKPCHTSSTPLLFKRRSYFPRIPFLHSVSRLERDENSFSGAPEPLPIQIQFSKPSVAIESEFPPAAAEAPHIFCHTTLFLFLRSRKSFFFPFSLVPLPPRCVQSGIFSPLFFSRNFRTSTFISRQIGRDGREKRPSFIYICAFFFLEKLNPGKPFLSVRCRNEIRRNHMHRLPNLMPQK